MLRYRALQAATMLRRNGATTLTRQDGLWIVYDGPCMPCTRRVPGISGPGAALVQERNGASKRRRPSRSTRHTTPSLQVRTSALSLSLPQANPPVRRDPSRRRRTSALVHEISSMCAPLALLPSAVCHGANR